MTTRAAEWSVHLRFKRTIPTCFRVYNKAPKTEQTSILANLWSPWHNFKILFFKELKSFWIEGRLRWMLNQIIVCFTDSFSHSISVKVVFPRMDTMVWWRRKSGRTSLPLKGTLGNSSPSTHVTHSMPQYIYITCWGICAIKKQSQRAYSASINPEITLYVLWGVSSHWRQKIF